MRSHSKSQTTRGLVLFTLLATACSGGDSSERPAREGTEGGTDSAGSVIQPLSPFSAIEPPVGELFPSKDELRIAYAHVQVEIDGDIARTRVTEVVINDGESEVSGEFSFPLPDDAAVTDFATWQDGKRISASLSGKSSARKTFDEAVAKGEKAAIAETEGHLFRMELSPLASQTQRRIELSYTQSIAPLGGERRYVFPAKRYQESIPTLLDMDLQVSSDREITEARTWNHRDARLVRRSAKRYDIQLSRTRDYLGKDLVISWEQEVSDLDLAGRADRPSADEAGYVETRFLFQKDPYPESRPPRQIVLVMDRSLSMAGGPLANAQELAASVLDSLSAEDAVSLIHFGSGIDTTTLEPATESHRSALLEKLSELSPQGHSNLEAALDEAAIQVKTAANPVVLLMSDGQPTVGEGIEDEDVASAATRTDFSKAKVIIAHFNYPGRGVALDKLFPGAARHFVPDGEAGEEAVRSLSRLAVAPVIEGFEMKIIGANQDQVHGDMPGKLAMGESVRLLARADQDVTVEVRGTLRGRPIHLQERIFVASSSAPTADRGLAVEWARLRIRDLEARFSKGEDKLEDPIRELGKKYRLATRFTSFVATDSLAPDRIMPGDPEIRIRAPQDAREVFGVLPWGEVVECTWSDSEELWLGRFLVPRATPDGLYRVRVYVTKDRGENGNQEPLVEYRGSLPYRVDSAPPTFSLELKELDGRWTVIATPELDVFDRRGDSIRDDLVDLKRISVRIGEEVLVLNGNEDRTWTASLPEGLSVGSHELVLVAVDFAANSSETRALLIHRPVHSESAEQEGVYLSTTPLFELRKESP